MVPPDREAEVFLGVIFGGGALLFFVYGGLRIFLRNAYGILIWNPFG